MSIAKDVVEALGIEEEWLGTGSIAAAVLEDLERVFGSTPFREPRS